MNVFACRFVLSDPFAKNCSAIESRDTELSPEQKIIVKVHRSSENDPFEVGDVAKNMDFR